MKTDLVQSLTQNFEAHANRTESGVEFWLARDLQHLLGYAEWRNFASSAVSKARTACELTGHRVAVQFFVVKKNVDILCGSQSES
jgi:DNA-damage-inducible protein D